MALFYRWILPLLYSFGVFLLTSYLKDYDIDAIYIALLILMFVFVVPILYWYVGQKFQLLKVR